MECINYWTRKSIDKEPWFIHRQHFRTFYNDVIHKVVFIRETYSNYFELILVGIEAVNELGNGGILLPLYGIVMPHDTLKGSVDTHT